MRTAGYADADAHEKTVEHGERLRLLYVACTRAESRRAVSLHRKEAPPGKEDPTCVSSEVLARASFGVRSSTYSTPDPRRWLPEVELSRPEPSTWEAWSASHASASERSGAREAISATAIAHGEVSLPSFPPGLVKDPVDLELPLWRKGRYGEAFGRAVHAVLQTIDLASGDGLRDLAESQAHAEGVLDAVDDVEAAVRSALASEVVQRAAVRPHWRETYVGTVIDGKLVEGYIDLLSRDDDGLVLVDFKTDSYVDAEKLETYERQLRVYERALTDSINEPVSRSMLLFPVVAAMIQEVARASR